MVIGKMKILNRSRKNRLFIIRIIVLITVI